MIGIVGSEHSDISRDDEVLRIALETAGVEASRIRWDDSSVEWAEFDLLLIRSTWDYHTRLAEFRSWLQKVWSITSVLNPLEVIENNFHKSYLVRLASLGVPVVPTQMFVGGTSRFPEEEFRNLEIVIKPTVSATARLTQIFRADDPAAQDHFQAVSQEGDVLIQAYQASIKTKGEKSLIFFDREFVHAVRKLPKAGDFRVQSDFGGTAELCEVSSSEMITAKMALEQTPGDLLYARVDIVDGDNGRPVIMELELIEPELFLAYSEEATQKFVKSIQARL